MTIVTVTLKIIDQHNEYNDKKSLKYCQKYQNVTQIQSEQMPLEKNGTSGLARCRVATDFQFLANAVSVKH